MSCCIQFCDRFLARMKSSVLLLILAVAVAIVASQPSKRETLPLETKEIRDIPKVKDEPKNDKNHIHQLTNETGNSKLKTVNTETHNLKSKAKFERCQSYLLGRLHRGSRVKPNINARIKSSSANSKLHPDELKC